MMSSSEAENWRNIEEVPFYGESENNLEAAFQAAKAALMKVNADSNLSLYDHLTNVIKEILNTKPDDALNCVEIISQNLKSSVKPVKPSMISAPIPETDFLDFYVKQAELFLQKENIAEDAIEPEFEEGDSEEPIFDLIQAVNLLSKVGIYFSTNETFSLNLAIKLLAGSRHLSNYRFWGKIYGTLKDYYVVEADYINALELNEELIRNDEVSSKKSDMDENISDLNEDKDETEDLSKQPSLPKLQKLSPLIIPSEEPGSGVNQKSYFVCNRIGDNWYRLPDCKPDAIKVSRHTENFFTGNLDAKIETFSPFLRKEQDYLRVQIARISAATHICPVGYYIYDEEETYDADEEDYEPLMPEDLNNFNAWVHCKLCILPQGRTSWWNPNEDQEELEEDEDEEEYEEKFILQRTRYEPEVAPSILSPISEDAPLDGVQPWSVRLINKTMGNKSLAAVISNIWPGAVTVSDGTIFINMYIGYGMKYRTDNYIPLLPLVTANEYSSLSNDVKEIDDPTPKDEMEAKHSELDEKLSDEEMEEISEDEEDEDED